MTQTDLLKGKKGVPYRPAGFRCLLKPLTVIDVALNEARSYVPSVNLLLVKATITAIDAAWLLIGKRRALTASRSCAPKVLIVTTVDVP